MSKKISAIESKVCLVSFFLRVGLALVFLYAAISSFLSPSSWIGFIPLFLRNLIDANLLLFAFSFYEIILGLWLLSNKTVFYASLLSALTILGIVISNLGALDIVFRDIAILFSAIALMILSYKRM
ncbi:hypothetical protein COU62_00290 [Candidatus Pacearchaeota archaeon CG10_big_fil_rev_8_21_14_0_10_35_219]|nr:hypothetical protein [Candidatus Pacearchaeota archaeon]OIO42488.1 MAG: hypothetical protein AUJ63_02710 [Candidatus Pacearchaeota archaeon CG1_02_35_32]PIO08422.1 MAG: hypothetical protein COU62_00290 [Candidatus Pacearchaeota archaeon CG10_big_fil_rev_8_21_14_0_10_35_219]PIY81815.1 MAG: hypothetical protein COY79_00745 [Candidatus Pacearchaeota archaeon CG_4_10_14_0_8_um_filter_35_169]PIZ80067.1 MAG: hypothetical protein COY00_02250 [Candidatus Pacearchaeota archaeon CG_4_10_14_0_2_um_filt